MKGLRHEFRHAGLLALVLPAVAPAPTRAQMALAVELRAGAAYSTPFARSTTLVPAELEAVARDLEVGPRLGPSAELALSGGPSTSVVLELRAGASTARVAGHAAGNSWEAGRATTLHLLGGARFPLSQVQGLDLRAGVGKAIYLSGDVNLLDGPANTGLLLSAGVGYRLPGPLRSTALAEIQRHPFQPAALADAGAGEGAVTRLLVHLAISVWGTS